MCNDWAAVQLDHFVLLTKLFEANGAVSWFVEQDTLERFLFILDEHSLLELLPLEFFLALELIFIITPSHSHWVGGESIKTCSFDYIPDVRDQEQPQKISAFSEKLLENLAPSIQHFKLIGLDTNDTRNKIHAEEDGSSIEYPNAPANEGIERAAVGKEWLLWTLPPVTLIQIVCELYKLPAHGS